MSNEYQSENEKKDERKLINDPNLLILNNDVNYYPKLKMQIMKMIERIIYDQFENAKKRIHDYLRQEKKRNMQKIYKEIHYNFRIN
jgi:hypothetical protein